MLATLALALAPIQHRVLVVEGEPFPGAAPGEFCTDIAHPFVNSAGDLIVSLPTDGPLGTSGVFWGWRGVLPPGVLRRPTAAQGVLDWVPQTTAAGRTVYKTRSSWDWDTVWVEDTPLLTRGTPTGYGTERFREFLGVVVAEPGITCFIADLEDPSGALTGNALFVGHPPRVLLRGGDSLPLLPPIADQGIYSGPAISTDASDWFVIVRLGSLQMIDEVVVRNGEPFRVGNSLLRTGASMVGLPGALNGELWINFSVHAVADNGEYAMRISTNAHWRRNQFILRNGAIFRREGQPAEVGVLRHGPGSISTTKDGTIAYHWAIEDGEGEYLSAVHREMEMLSLTGDAVDLNGDGRLDVGTSLAGLWSSRSVVIAEDRTVYAVQDVEIDGIGIRRALMRMDSRRIGRPVCEAEPNSTGVSADLWATGSDERDGAGLELRASSLPARSRGYFLTSRATGHFPAFAGSAGTLCLDGIDGRLDGPGQVVRADANGDAHLTVDLRALPETGGLSTTVVGETWHFQLWYRDQDSTGNATTNFSRAIAVDLR